MSIIKTNIYVQYTEIFKFPLSRQGIIFKRGKYYKTTHGCWLSTVPLKKLNLIFTTKM